MNFKPVTIGEYEASPSFYLGNSAFNPEWLPQLGIPEPSVILDIGSYDCGDAIRFKQRFPKAKVYAFEADPSRSAIIKSYIYKFQVRFYPIAITRKWGLINFYPSQCHTKDAGSTHQPGLAGGQGSIFKHSAHYKECYPQIKQSEEPVLVPSMSLYEFLGERDTLQVDLLHIDVEGAEMEVLKSNNWEVSKPKVIFLETLDGMFENNNSSASEIHKYLTEKNYTLAGDFGTDKLYVL